LADILDIVSPIRIVGHSNVNITGVASIDKAQRGDLSFCSLKGEQAYNAILSSSAGVIICHDLGGGDENVFSDRCLIITDNPRLSFSRCLRKFFTPARQWGVHATAIVERDAIVCPNSFIGSIAYIGHHAEIGDGTIIEHNVFIASNCKIGKNVYIQSGAIVGCEGQGYERSSAGNFEKFPQIGYVVIEDDVEIGANAVIVRGTLSETRIEEGSKIGNLVNIGHNVTIGKHVFISASAVVCGSAKIGNYAWLAPGCCIKNKIKIGERTTVGLGAVVTKDVADHDIVFGVPARSITAK
jgi:UDP-3-O-[3-hydroxymyristoyl] glucosamine N-acyltransferase